MGANFISLSLTFAYLAQSFLFDTQVYPDVVQYQLAIEGQNHTIHLEKNRDLIGKDFTETHYTKDGKRVTTSTHE
ncbi:hypothetical protein WMY93_010711 [Mugilogobius chulae]|uniref:Peptidase M12B propeptide domain-containing protein n=1 Tax=Mugilogobius chulae TaxID=88201 RepID=A0AAW0PH13_9GOBI